MTPPRCLIAVISGAGTVDSTWSNARVSIPQVWHFITACVGPAALKNPTRILNKDADLAGAHLSAASGIARNPVVLPIVIAVIVIIGLHPVGGVVNHSLALRLRMIHI